MAETRFCTSLQPQDFVHEWLTRLWEQMQSRSGASDTLVKWHNSLHADSISGDYEFVQTCINGETPTADYDQPPSLFKKK